MNVLLLRHLSVVFILIMLASCTPRQSDMIVLELGKTKVSLSEYEQFYIRNSGGEDLARQSSMEERERFLDLLTNYRLKVLDARSRGFLEDPEIKEELADYRTSVASTFLIDREIIQPAVEKTYERKKEEIRLKHILIELKPYAIPEDTLKAFNRAMDIIERAKRGENFDSLVFQFSEDPNAKVDGGDIYYFNVFQVSPSIEDAAYSMKKGQISDMPVRSPFGYHILKIVDRQPSRGLVKARHIMARFSVSPTDSADTTNALIKIKGYQDSLKKGWDFSQLAIQFSEDPGSASAGGDLGWFERRNWIQTFDEAVFKLQPGKISDIVKTRFGYHLIRCDSVRPLPSFSELYDELKQRYRQTRFNDDYKKYIDNLKKEYNYSYSDSIFQVFISYLDSNQVVEDSAWDANINADIRQQPLMMIAGKPVSLDIVINILNKRPEFRMTALRRNELLSKIEKIAEGLLMGERSIGLEDRNPDFRRLMGDYEDGVVLFKAEQAEVWNRVTVSDSALRDFFQQNKSKYMHPMYVDIDEIRVDYDTLAYMIYDSLLKGADFGELAGRYNDDDNLRKNKGARGRLKADTDEVTRFAADLEVGQFSEPIALDFGGFSIARLNTIEYPREKTFEEASAEVSNDYQEQESKRLEKEWLERIKSENPVKQYKDRLRYAFKELKNR